MRVGELLGILLDGSHFAPIPKFPLIVSSYDRPPTGGSQEMWDFDRVLGEYQRPSKILVHEQAVSECSTALGIPRRELRAIVVLHECAHYFVDQLPSAGASVGDWGTPGCVHRLRWVDSGYQNTPAEVHETIAQLLTYWTCQDSWLRDDFEKLNVRQSSEYRRFRELIDAGITYPSVVAAIAKARRTRDGGTDFVTWMADLSV